jgi:DNA-binding transcriptional MerR regulator
MDKQILDTYNNNGFIGAAKLKVILKKQNIDVSLKKIKEVIDKQETHQVFKQQHKKIQGKIVSFRKDSRLNIDLIDMVSLKSANKNYTFILIVIDIFSRKVYAKALKNKSGPTVAEALEPILKKLEDPAIMTSDSGTEFLNSYVKDVLKKFKIAQYTVEIGSHQALGVIDSAIRNIKNMLYKTMNSNKNSNWIDILESVTNIYNTNPHSALDNLAPNEINNTQSEGHINEINYQKKLQQFLIQDLLLGILFVED